MSQIRNITIKGFKSIKSIKDLELRPLNILIGANGAGKSNFLSSLDMLKAAVVSRRQFVDIVERKGGGKSSVSFWR